MKAPVGGPRPSNFRIYRPTVALELSIMLPRPDSEGTYLEPGRLFVAMAKGVAKESYDWSGALRLALATGELGQLLDGLEGGSEVSLVHDPGAGSSSRGSMVKALKLSRGADSRVMLSMGAKTKGQWRSAGTIGLSSGEVVMIRELLKAAVPLLLGWRSVA